MSSDELIYLATIDSSRGEVPAIFSEGAPDELIDLQAASAYFRDAGAKGDHDRIASARDVLTLIDAGIDRELLATYVARKGELPDGAVVPGGGTATIGSSPKLRAPVQPRQLPCIGMNRGELFEPGQTRSPGRMPQIREAPSYAPFWWLKAVTSITHPNAPVIHPGPSHTTFLIPEPELGLVIGKRLGPGIATPKAKDAMEYFAGYTIVNEMSALDIEFERGGDPFAFNLAWSKSYPTFAPLGPAIALAGDLDPNRLAVSLRINGNEVLRASTADYLWSAAELIEHFAAVVILEPGDVIACGNLDRAHPVEVGDVMEIAFERLGVLRNPMVAAAEELRFTVPERARDYASRFNAAASARVAGQG